MATYTDNLELVMPTSTDFVNIEDINSNMETIDEAFGSISGKIGAADDEAGSTTTGTVMGKLNKMLEGGESKNWVTHKFVTTTTGTFEFEGLMNLKSIYSTYMVADLYVNDEVKFTTDNQGGMFYRPTAKSAVFFSTENYPTSGTSVLTDFYVKGTVKINIKSKQSYGHETFCFTYDLWE